jgi:NADH-quinone oxidoreductase subunit L
MGFATLVALSGVFLAYLMYYKGSISPERLKQRFGFIYKVLYNKYYFDEIYNAIIVNPILKLSSGLFRFDLGIIDWLVNFFGNFTLFLSKIKEWFDTNIVDGGVNGVAYVLKKTGLGLRQIQTGQLQNYALIIFFGIVLILLFKIA